MERDPMPTIPQRIASAPEGRCNGRARAEAVVAAALPHLSGTAWDRTRRLLLRRESFTFSDQAARLADLGVDCADWAWLLDLEGLRRQPLRLSAATRLWASVRAVHLTKAFGLAERDAAGPC